jgi:predicted phage terminase large subunit-like protein
MLHDPTIDDVRYVLAEKSLEDFIRIGWPYIDPAAYIPNWHIGAIADRLEAVAEGHCRRLIIMMPPRHMKSLSVSVSFIPWVWAQQKRSPLTGPGVGCLAVSYAQTLSVRDNVKCRRLIESRWYQNGWGDRFALASDQNTKMRFENDQGGYRIATSVEGFGTGDGGDIILIDDPISAGDSLSPVTRAAVNEWFDGTMTTRLNNPKTGAYIVVMQRLHEDDLVGHVLERAADEWEVLCLPARYEPDHPFVYAADPRTEPGQLLWPDRMGEKEIKALEMALGSYGAAGQLQQRPAPREGGMFKRHWFEVVDAAPADLEEVAAWDLAATVPEPGTDPDFTVRVKIGRSRDGFFYILDVLRFRDTPAKVEKTIKTTASQDGRRCRIRIPEDPGQAGKSQAKSFIRMLAGYAVRAVKPTGSKETRATPFAAQCEAGNVKIVKAPWNEVFFDEIEVFPFGRHDDQVDAATDAFVELAGAEGSAGFLTMIHRDLADVAERKATAEAEATAAADEGGCPYPKGSLEYLKHHGLVA